MIEQLFIGQLFTISSSAEVFHLNSPTLLDDLVSLGLKLDHRREVGLNSIRSPYLSVNDTVEGPA